MTNEQQNRQSNASIDLGQVIAGIWKRKSWMFFTTALAAVGSVFFVMTATPAYQSESRVLVENLETSLTRLGRQGTVGERVDQQEVVSQVEVMQSRDLVLRVINDLNLMSDPEFSPPKKSHGFISQTLISLGFKSDSNKNTPEQRVLKKFYKKFTAYQIPQSKVIVVNVNSEKPKKAALIANKIAEEFVSTTRQVQSQSTNRARSWLKEQITTLRKKVIESEVAAEKFRAEAGLLKGRDNNATLSSQELSELNSQIILAEAQRAEIQARAKAIKNLLATQGSVSTSNEVLKSPLIQRLRERQITLEGNIADLSTTYLPNHPRIRSVRRELAGLQRQIRREALKIVAGLEQQAKVASTRESSLRASLNNLKTRASGSNLDEVKLRALEREAKANSALLNSFLTKFSDASARDKEAFQPGRARIISTAQVPAEPYFPKKGPTVVLATLGGFFLSAGLAFMAAVMSAVSGGAANQRQSARTGPKRTAAAARNHSQAVSDHQPEITPDLRESVPVPQTAQQAVQSAPQPVSYAAPSPAQNQAMPNQAATVATPAIPTAIVAGHKADGDVSPPYYAPSAPTSGADDPLRQRYSEPYDSREAKQSNDPSLSQIPFSANINTAVSHAAEIIMAPGNAYAKGLKPVANWADKARQAVGFTRVGVVGIPGSDLDTAAACLGLARTLAEQNCRTIIIDAAMQGSKLAEMTRAENLPGLADLITGHAPFVDVITKDEISKVRILRVGQRLKLAWPLLASDRMETIFAALEGSGTYDLIIVHAGHLPAESMARNGALAKCQSSLLMVQSDQVDAAPAAMKALEAAGLASSQYVKIINGDGARKTGGKVSELSDVIAANNGVTSPSPQPSAAVMEMPMFDKVVG